jgi:signal transduction histidine kinase
MDNWNEVIIKDISYHLAEVFRIRKSIEQFYILSDADYGEWQSYKVNIDEFIAYLEIYKQRFEMFYLNNEYFHIHVEVINKLVFTKNFYLPFTKIKEVIDVLMHNAAEELVEKDRECSFEKSIKCIIEENNKNIILSVIDNGRGIIDQSTIKNAFVTTKNTFKNSGIGLDIANKIARNLKASLISSNNAYGGATFRFTFPQEVNVTQEGFRQKINIHMLSNMEKVEVKLKELMLEYKDTQIVRAETKSVINELINENIISCIDIVLSEKGNELIQYITQANFKGDFISV